MRMECLVYGSNDIFCVAVTYQKNTSNTRQEIFVQINWCVIEFKAFWIHVAIRS